MGKQARSISDEERALRDIVREAHEAAQENAEILREIKKQRQEWENDAHQLVKDALDQTRISIDGMGEHLKELLRATEERVNDTTARYFGVQRWEELMAIISAAVAGDLREIVLEAFGPHLPALADKAVGRFIKAQVDAEGERLPAIWVEKGNGVGRIVIDPK